MNKDFMIEVLEQNFTPKNFDINWPDWKRVLIEDFDNIDPKKCQIRNYCNGWLEYDNNDVFIYTTSNIRGAKLLSSDRKKMLFELIEMNIIKSDYPLYPPTNDHGRLWINQDYFTSEFKSKINHSSQVQLFLHKSKIYLKFFKDSHWKDEVIDLQMLKDPKGNLDSLKTFLESGK